MSINDQVAGFGASRVFAMREDTIDPISQQGRSPPPQFLNHGTNIPSPFLERCQYRIGGVVMTTLRQIELRCPVCDNEFKSQSVVSTNAFGGKRTDFHERAAGTQPLAYLIHMCSECGFSGGEADFTAATDVSPVLKQQVLKELAPVRPALVCGSEKYEAAAKVAQWQGLEPRHVADLLLRAAWCCVDEGDIEAERYFGRHAA